MVRKKKKSAKSRAPRKAAARRRARKSVAKKKSARKAASKASARRTSSRAPGRAKPARKPKRAGADRERPPWPIEGRRIVILFKKEPPVPNTPGWRDKPGDWEQLRAKYGQIDVQPMFVTSAERLRALGQAAERADPKYGWPNFLHYFFLYVPRGTVSRVLRDIGKWPQLQSAYPDKATQNAASALMCGNPSQHLDAAPFGVNAAVARDFVGGRGEGQRLVDVEEGWAWRKHVRLPACIQLVAGASQPGGQSHGTRVLGVVCATDTMAGSPGIAPELQDAMLVSCIPDPAAVAAPIVHPDNGATARPENIYDAVAIGIGQLTFDPFDPTKNFGRGVLLIERMATGKLPLESLPTMFTLFALATDRGVTVVAAAGNGQSSLPLATFSQKQGGKTVDSGSIMVAAAKAGFPRLEPGKHARFFSSNFGSRIDCYALGESMIAPTWMPAGVDPPDGTGGSFDRCDDFGETSGAAAVIAGVALVIQGIVAAAGGTISPAKMRSVLSNPQFGTPCAAGAAINSMPNLAKILHLDANGFCPALGIKPVLVLAT